MICDCGNASCGCAGGSGDGGTVAGHRRYDSRARFAPLTKSPIRRAGVRASIAPASASAAVSGAMVADRPGPVLIAIPHASAGCGSEAGAAL